MRENRVALIIFQILFVVTFTISVLAYSLQYQLLNSNLYKQALDQSGFYTVIEDVAKEQTTAVVVDLQKQLLNVIVNTSEEDTGFVRYALGYGLNIVFETQTQNFINDLFDKIQIDNLVKGIAESQIDRDIAWLRGDTQGGKVFDYIPSTAELEQFKATTFNDLINQALFEVLKSNNITECTTREAIESNISLIREGEAPKITCISKEMVGLLKGGADAIIPEEAQQTLNTPLGDMVTGSQFEEVLESSYNLVYGVAQFKESAIQARYYLEMIKLYSAFGLGLSLLFIILAGFVAKAKTVTKTVLITTFYAGGFLTVCVLFYYLILSAFIFSGGLFNSLKIESTVLTQTQVLLIAESLNSAILYYLKYLPIKAFIVGIAVTVISAILILMHRIFGLEPVQKKLTLAKEKTVKTFAPKNKPNGKK